MDISIATGFIVVGLLANAFLILRLTYTRVKRIRSEHSLALTKLGEELVRRTDAEKMSKRWALEMQALLDNAVNGIATLDASGNIRSINRVACELFGYTPDEVVGKKISLFLPSVEEVRAGPAGTMYFCDATVQERETRWELIGRRKDGSSVPVEFSTKIVLHDDVPMCSAGIYDLSERKQSQKKIEESLKEKEVLLKEIHHRVKNNLQVISSIFNLQQRRTTDPVVSSLLLQSQNRVQAIALLHETLYRSQSLSQIDMGDYLTKLLNHHLRAGGNTDIVGRVDAHDVVLHIDKAIPCGLIINELLTNSIRHAFPVENAITQKTFTIELVPQAESQLLLRVSDSGVGLPDADDIEKATSTLGLRLVKTLCLQLHGTMNFRNEKGTKFEVSFQA